MEYLGKFDFTMLTSISEGMPLSVLESFAAGVPCITTDVGACKGLINGISREDVLGEAGICVPPMDIQGMVDAMYIMCTNHERRLRMGEVARARVKKYFVHKDMIRKYAEIYDEVNATWQE